MGARDDAQRERALGPGGSAGPPHEKSREVHRLVFFSDAVFAFALTLLVPGGPDYTHQVLAQWPKYLSYVISFLVVARYWLGHHRMFRYDQALGPTPDRSQPARERTAMTLLQVSSKASS